MEEGRPDTRPQDGTAAGLGLAGPDCRVCGAGTVPWGSKAGRDRPGPFHLRHCPRCHFSFVVNPRTDYEALYSADYYTGRGIDPLLDYVFELEHPRETVRQYEWRGVLRAVRSLVEVTSRTRWLDYGCGNGGLLRHCREATGCAIAGYDEGWIQERAARAGIPFLSAQELDARAGTFDVVTAIEVLEHLVDPLETLCRIRQLLRPGGLFFYTTGNAEPFRARLTSWSYVCPEIHVSYFEPGTLARALGRAGFRPEMRGYLPGFTDIIRFKILKALRLRRRSVAERLLPWPLLTRLADHFWRVSAHPVAWAVE